MTTHILIYGQGLLADLVYNQLSESFIVKRHSILEEVPDDTKLALVLHDAWYPSVHQKRKKDSGPRVSHGFEVSLRLGKD